jgi:hypothetical protein
MSFCKYLGISVLLMVVLAFIAGCTSPQVPTPPSQASAASTSAGAQASASAVPVKSASIDTMVNVHFNDFACLDVQKEQGKEYLYPDEKYRLSASPPGTSNVNVNVLFVDDRDNIGIRGVKPQWDAVQKKWMYEGIVPLAQFDDITVPVEKTFTIKTQSKYYICVDDRKETGVSDVMIQVPVKLQRL